MREQSKEGYYCGWEWGKRGKREGDVNVGGGGGTEGIWRGIYNRGKREVSCKCEWECGNRGKRVGM